MGENFEEKKCKEIISTVAVILFNKFSGLGIRSLAHRSFAHFPQIKWVIVSNSLRLLKTNERPWAICSGCSEEMSELVIRRKIWLTKYKILFFSMFYIRFLLFKKWANRSFPLFRWASDVSELLRSLTKNERCERSAQVAPQKWAWVVRSHCSEEMSDRERIAQVAHQKWANEWITRFFERIAHSLIFGQKISDSLGKPMSEFPALFKSKILNHFLIFFKLKIPNLKEIYLLKIPNHT